MEKEQSEFRMRIVVIGAGVLGSLYAGRLASSGQDVRLLARGARLAELQREPLQLFDDAGRRLLRCVCLWSLNSHRVMRMTFAS
jgi:ketopantoate reductase